MKISNNGQKTIPINFSLIWLLLTIFFIFPYILPFAALGYLLTYERKKQYIFNRDTNTFSITEKALFKNAYKLKTQISLDEITRVTIHNNKIRLERQSAELIKLPIDVNYAAQINAFLAGNEPYLTITNNPYKLRLIGVLVIIILLALTLVPMIQLIQNTGIIEMLKQLLNELHLK